MEIFFAGATGAIGRPLLDRLLMDGHEVTTITRSQEKAEQLRRRGAKVVVTDVFDHEKLRQAVMEAQPAVIINQMTSIPRNLDVRNIALEFAQTNRLRSEGTKILLEAAQAAGAGQFIAQSFAPFYRPGRRGLATEDQTLYLDAPPDFVELVQAIASLEQAVLNTPRIAGTVMRYGHFYGPGTAYARDGDIAEAVRQQLMPIIGSGKAELSFVHVEDAAEATMLAMQKGGPGIYNIVDDDPAPVKEWLPMYAELLKAPQPIRLSRQVRTQVAGNYAWFFMNEQRGASNQKAKQQLGWQPHYASWRDGFRAEIQR